MSTEPTPVLPFTGERFTPECVREIWYEHMHRYAFAAQYASGRRVLDAASGEGYGSALLAAAGADVLGVDISAEAVAHAGARYAGTTGLHFQCADATLLEQLPDAGFDLIVCFETLEHVHEQERMLAGFHRLLAPDGLLLVSCPDKRNYSDRRGYVNEHHVRELYRPELESLLARHFPARRLLAQKLLFQSVLWDPDAAPSSAGADTLLASGALEPGLHYDPLYYLALCAHDPAVLPLAPASLHLFGDAAESVYTHYNDEIRRIIAAGHRLIALEQELAAAHARIAELECERAADPNQGRK